MKILKVDYLPTLDPEKIKLQVRVFYSFYDSKIKDFTNDTAEFLINIKENIKVYKLKLEIFNTFAIEKENTDKEFNSNLIRKTLNHFYKLKM